MNRIVGFLNGRRAFFSCADHEAFKPTPSVAVRCFLVAMTLPEPSGWWPQGTVRLPLRYSG